ncbi:MAG TPA: hypothetical protein VMR25_15720 [Planctomycetaceae bacterium]|nr:hypothetical protein [Planctomycetaceae bacterium]
MSALHPAVPSSAVPKWVCMKGYNHLTVIIDFLNTTTVTGSAIGLAQATAVAGTGTKTLGFVKMWALVDDGSSNIITETAVVANTFTTSAVNSKSGFYIIEVDANTLDIANKFTSIQATVGNATAATIGVYYILGGYPRFGGAPESFMNPLSD